MRSKGTGLAILSACMLLACGPSKPSGKQAPPPSAESQAASQTLDLSPDALADERYHLARELAREGSFEEAEGILRDLANNFPETPGGQKAADHLAFDFSFGRAQYYLIHERFDEAANVARGLLQQDLTIEQAQQTEQLLDRLAQVDAVLQMAERHNARAEVRQITVALMTAFVEEGRFPASLTPKWLEDLPNYSGSPRFITRIEGYRATADNVSFTAITESGYRIRVVNGQMLD